jgi:hypothetical protein
MNEDQIQSVAAQHGFSLDVVRHLYSAILVGRGTMVQFNHPELGGSGQWMRGGMIMIGDMFNQTLKVRVEALCNELAQRLHGGSAALGTAAVPPFPSAAGGWWPVELGQPTMIGGQNDLAYAYFPASQRLTVRHGDTVTVYDTAGYTITGFSQQQQPGLQGIYISSQQSLIALVALPVVESRKVYGAS